MYPDIITAGNPGETPYYTNSSHLPVGFTEDVFEALSVQDELQTLYTSGTVFHCFLGEKLPDWKAAAKLVRTIAENYKLPYYTMSPTYSICPNHGYLAGEVAACPHCGHATEVYSRITGYYRPVQNWNEGKLQEFTDRKTYVPETSKVTFFMGTANNDPSMEVTLPEEISEEREEEKEADITRLLFTTKTCPNCQLAKQFLEGITYTVMDAEEHRDLAMQYGIMQAPTLVVLEGDEVKKYANASNIKRYVAELEEE